MGARPSRPWRPTRPERRIDPDVLIRHMEENTDVVLQYYSTNRDFIEKYIVENFWEEDVENWLKRIRERSPSEVLQVRKIEYLKTANGFTNNTSLFESKSLVVRRASTFDLNLHFGSRGFDAERDDMTIEFSLGKQPSEASGTKFSCKVGIEPGSKTSWHCYLLPSGAGMDAKTTPVRVNVPANAIVARYKVSLNIISGTKEGRKESKHNDNDTVYMGDQSLRNEYVLNDRGFINTGSSWRIGTKKWDFAQFDEGVLDNVLEMLANDSRHLSRPLKSWKKRGNPVYVSRVLTAMVNCNDDKGVLFGRWDGEYDEPAGSKTPGSWASSAVILKQWRDNEMTPVRYGQCWVFSGILTTALRAIGIPARSVTNFDSAHDTDGNATVDMYYAMDSGDKLEETSDSVWNFHVWNEGYFKRPDLGQGYDGWQVLDATPQEVSEVIDPLHRARALFQCGPAPVKAIKEGNINIGYDGMFIYSEVNADKVNWVVKDGKITGVAEVLKRSIGRNISTKAVGRDVREDITDTYKYPEGSGEERISFRNAYGRGTMDHSGEEFKHEGFHVEPKFEIEIQQEDTVLLGSDIVKTLKIKNTTEKTLKTSIKVVATSKRHIGLTHMLLKKLQETVDIEAGKVEEIKFEIKAIDYYTKVVDNNIINIRVVATDIEDGNTRVGEMDIPLVMPDCISVELPATLKRHEDSTFDIVFNNLLPFPLSKGVFDVNLRGNIHDDTTITVEKSILPGETYTVKDVKVSPKIGWSYIYVHIVFDCAELREVEHAFKMKVDA